MFAVPSAALLLKSELHHAYMQCTLKGTFNTDLTTILLLV
jgi:hypothetical protein